jgi:predicted O-methyltransferase YrrM
VARGFFARDPVGARIELVEGDALETLRRQHGPVGMAFVDGNPAETRRYLQLLEGELAQRALVVVGRLAPGDSVARELAASPAWSFSVLPLGDDGVGLGARRATVAP